MTSTVLITGADRGLGLALCSGLLEQGWRVFAGQFMPEWPELSDLADRYPETLHIVPLDVRSIDSARDAAKAVAGVTDRLDVLINNAGIFSLTSERSIHEAQDYLEMHRQFDVNALGALRVVETFLPLMADSDIKRLCFVSSEAGSITHAERSSWFGYCMSKAALNMATRILFTALRPEGYTLRLYHPGWIRSYMEGDKNMAANLEPEEAAARALPVFLGQNEDEDRLVLVDFEGKEWPW